MFTHSSEAHVSVDIETLGVKPGCVILSIGACSMFNDGNAARVFHVAINTEDQVNNHGLLIDPATQAWWAADERKDARRGLFDSRLELATVLGWFNKFLASLAGERRLLVWAKSPSFDCAILKAGYAATGIDCPWIFRDERDVRTAVAMASIIAPEFAGTVHNALDDARHQALCVEAAYRKVTGTPL